MTDRLSRAAVTRDPSARHPNLGFGLAGNLGPVRRTAAMSLSKLSTGRRRIGRAIPVVAR